MRRTTEQIDANFRAKVFASWPHAVFDEECRAAFWVGPWRRGARLKEGCKHRNGPWKPLTAEEESNYTWELDSKNGLQMFLRNQPCGKGGKISSSRRRFLGEIGGGVLDTWRLENNRRHYHPKLGLFCIAKYVIVHAATFGFHAVEINEHLRFSVADILAMPEVPTEFRGPFETQFQILGTEI